MTDTFADYMIRCKRCAHDFVWTSGEQQFYRRKGISPPSHCPTCRAQRRHEREEYGRPAPDPPLYTEDWVERLGAKEDR